MIKVFIDYAVDLPSHILLKMPNLKVLSREVQIVKGVEKGLPDTISFKPLSEEELKNSFLPVLQAGDDVLYVSISAQLSKTVKRAMAVIKELKKQFPQREIEHIDTCNLSLASGYLAYFAYRLAEQGKTLSEIKKIINNHKIKKYSFFIVDDLKHLKDSKKISSDVLAVGAKLNVKPILTINTKGQIEKYSQVLGAKRALNALAGLVSQHGRNVADHRIGIIYSGNIQRAFDLRNLLLEKYQIEGNIDIMEVGPQILATTGEGVLGIVFNGKGVR